MTSVTDTPHDDEPRGFGIMPRHLAGRLTLAKLGVYVALSWHAGPDGTCYPSHATIAHEIGTSVNTVRRAIDGLTEKGLLVKRARAASHGGQTSNLYLLMIWREQGGWSHRPGGYPHRAGGVPPVGDERDSVERDSMNNLSSPSATASDPSAPRPVHGAEGPLCVLWQGPEQPR